MGKWARSSVCVCLPYNIRAPGKAGEPWSCQSHIQEWGMPHPGGWTGMCSQLPLLPSLQMISHTLTHKHLPHTPQMNRRTATAATGLGKTEQRCRGRDFSGEILAICRTTDSFLWAFPRWIILSRPNMLIEAGAQPALYPLTGHHHIPAKDWKSKETKPKQKWNCMLRRKKTLLPAGNLRRPCGTSTVNKNWTSDLFLVPLETVVSQGLAAFTVLPQVSMMRDKEEICLVPGEAELEGTRGTHEGPGREKRWGGLFIEYEPTKSAWLWSQQFPLRHRINWLPMVGADLQQCPPE